MKAIIEVDVPDYQIGQEVSIYFKDTMRIEGIVQEPTPNDDYFRKMAGVVISQLRTDRDRLEDELAKREQEPKTGHWIESDAVLVIGYSETDNFLRIPAKECSVCHKPHIRGYGMNYCPNCGARMVEPQESEDKE